MSTRIKTGYAKDEPTPKSAFEDLLWARENRKYLYETYGTSVALIYQKRVLAVGQSHSEVMAIAEANLPDDSEVITPVFYIIGNPAPMRYVLIKQWMREYNRKRRENSSEE
jgi:hypothetical protein